MFSLRSTDYADLHRLKKSRLRESAKICEPIILEQQPQNRAQVFAPELKMRCRPLAKTKMRSKTRHPDLVHGKFWNWDRSALWQEFVPGPRVKPPRKHRATRARALPSRQRSAAPAAN